MTRGFFSPEPKTARYINEVLCRKTEKLQNKEAAAPREPKGRCDFLYISMEQHGFIKPVFKQ